MNYTTNFSKRKGVIYEPRSKNIPFGEDELLGVKTEDGQVWLAVRKTCRDIGLTDAQSRAEVTKIQQALLFENSYQKLSLKFETQVRETLVLSEKFVPMWLAQINLTPMMRKNNPKAVEKLLKYQLECVDVLHEAFTATEEKKAEFYNSLGIEGRIEELNETIDELTYEVNDLSEKFDDVQMSIKMLIDNQTLNSRQCQKLLEIAKCRVRDLLGGVDTAEYKANSRKYFKRLWGNLAAAFETNTYKDLNPVNFDEAKLFVSRWVFAD